MNTIKSLKIKDWKEHDYNNVLLIKIIVLKSNYNQHDSRIMKNNLVSRYKKISSPKINFLFKY